RNAVPSDPNGPWYTSGIRLGTPALTTRGFGEDDLREVASMMDDVLRSTQPGSSKAKYDLDAATAERVRSRAADLVEAHPLYPEIDLGA
ncbi:MAG: glycine hydroxymethyltransferase, partial [Frankiaceae bacterium]|nr:glycine hydroxymethyltransferase [Frankiaceae bacterium]